MCCRHQKHRKKLGMDITMTCKTERPWLIQWSHLCELPEGSSCFGGADLFFFCREGRDAPIGFVRVAFSGMSVCSPHMCRTALLCLGCPRM